MTQAIETLVLMVQGVSLEAVVEALERLGGVVTLPPIALSPAAELGCRAIVDGSIQALVPLPFPQPLEELVGAVTAG